MIQDKNEERKEIVQAIYEEAKSLVDPNKSVQVLAKEGWNPRSAWDCSWSLVGRIRADSYVLILKMAVQGECSKY